jgi:glutathione S-transferase
MLTMYYAPHTCSLAPYIALVEAGADFTPYKVDFAAGEQNSAKYKELNPKGRVPALASNKGVMSENVAILSYIAAEFPKAKLAPEDAWHNGLMVAFNSYLSSTVHVNHAHNRRGYRWSDDPAVIEALRIKVPKNMDDCFSLIEDEFLKGPYVMGKQFTVADCYLLTISNWMENDGVDTAKHPKLMAHRALMMSRPAVAKAVAAHEAT